MKKLIIIALSIFISGILMNATVLSKGQGDQCMNDVECDFGLTCKSGACVKKPESENGKEERNPRQTGVRIH